ncbi:MAG: hypothetical protein Q8Q02_07790 [Nocardioides sp.]|nr:hypothetical protein [Nocardioides sp.]
MRAAESDATKTCPWCAETIKAAAVRCRYCRSDLPEAEAAADPEPSAPVSPEPESVSGAVAEAPTAPSTRWAALRGRWVLVVVGLLVAALAVALVVALLQWRDLAGQADARTSAQVAATSHVAAVLSYDAGDFDASTERAAEVMTTEFRREYEQTLELVRQDATDKGAVVEAEVTTAAVISASRDRVRLLLFVNQTTTREGDEEPRVDLNRVEVVLVRSDAPGVDGWKVADLQAL